MPRLPKSCIILFALTEILVGCYYHELGVTTGNTDESLFAELQEGNYSYFQGGKVLSPASASPHGSFRLRFNPVAAGALDVSGVLPKGALFPEGSIIVKEVMSGASVSVYAVMKKSRTDVNSGSGWLWAEFAPDSRPLFSIQMRGSGCVSCHSESPNRNLVRTFDLH